MRQEHKLPPRSCWKNLLKLGEARWALVAMKNLSPDQDNLVSDGSVSRGHSAEPYP